MIFQIDKKLDEIKDSYKKEYDANFMLIRATPKRPQFQVKLTLLWKRELFLQNRTKAFVQENRYYFSQKRLHIFNNLETRGVYGKMPATDKNKEELDRTRCHGLPKVIKRSRICESCGEYFMWFEHRPERECTICRKVEKCQTSSVNQ